MKMKNLSLRKPYLYSAVIKKAEQRNFFEANHENVNYLSIPENLDLKQDVKIGANQFEELNALVEKENEPKYILISADNLEQGYMAVTYLASAFNAKHEDTMEFYSNDTLDNTGGILEEWEENPFYIPVISEGELVRQAGDAFGSSPFGMGNEISLGNQPFSEYLPYWFECRQHPVCVVSAEGGYVNHSALEKGLNYFEHNDKVYVISVRNKPMFEFGFGSFEENDFEEEKFVEISRRKWNSLVLALAMDEANVILKKEKEDRYYKLLFQRAFYDKSIQPEKGFSYTKLLNLIKDMTNPDKCKLVESIVNYSVKDKKKSTKYTVSNKDFDFIDRFMRTQTEESDKAGKTSAREQMMKKLIGLESVKEQVIDVVNVMKYNRMRKDMKIGGGDYHNVHLMLGAPGTAKTTVAKLMGQIMMEEKLLPDNRFVCVNGAELKGKYVGHSAPKTKALFSEHDIIVIDEAYSLVGDHEENDSFSKEALAQLIIEVEEHSMDKLVIFAGYGGTKVSEKNNKMKAFLDANPGIKSRITSTIYFDSYSVDEMVSIFFHIAKNNNYHVEEEAKEIVGTHFGKRIHSDNFGNGREARRLLETAIVFAAKRLFTKNSGKITKEEMKLLKREDIEKAVIQIETGDGIQEPLSNRRKIGYA